MLTVLCCRAEAAGSAELDSFYDNAPMASGSAEKKKKKKKDKESDGDGKKKKKDKKHKKKDAEDASGTFPQRSERTDLRAC